MKACRGDAVMVLEQPVPGGDSKGMWPEGLPRKEGTLLQTSQVPMDRGLPDGDSTIVVEKRPSKLFYTRCTTSRCLLCDVGAWT